MNVLEIVSYQSNATEAEFLALNEQLQQWVVQQPGFIRRTVARDGKEVRDLVSWQSMEQAQAAAELIETQPFIEPFMASVVPESITMQHMPIAVAS